MIQSFYFTNLFSFSFVHGTACMNIVLKELSKPVLVPDILSWCWNPETKTSTGNCCLFLRLKYSVCYCSKFIASFSFKCASGALLSEKNC